jgi:PPM family protein phosphatase
VIVLRWGEATDVGRVRTNNEDAMYTSDRLFAVADGMGGHQGGEVASDVALRTLVESFVEPTTDGLIGAATEANDAIFERAAADPDLRGMGTTLVAIAPMEDSNSIAWINVGDSRLYLLRDGELTQISEDHSLVQEAVRSGELSPEEAQSHPQRNIVTRALGIDDEVDIDGDEVNAFAGDRYLLCSDGLTDYVDESRIASTLRRLADPTDAAHELVRLANEAGGRDNTTVVIVDVEGDDDQALAAAQDVDGGTAEGHALAASTSVRAPEAPAKEAPKAKPPKPRILTWRLVVFFVLFLLVIGGGAFAVGTYARNTYYVGFKGDSVLIFKGRPGGVLWFKPTVEQDTGLTRAQVPPKEIDRVTKGQEESSLQAARDYVDEALRPTTTTTTTVTTTTATTTPTTATSLPPPAN